MVIKQKYMNYIKYSSRCFSDQIIRSGSSRGDDNGLGAVRSHGTMERGWKRVCECGNKEESPGKTTWGSRHSTWGENEPRVLEIRGNVAAGK